MDDSRPEPPAASRALPGSLEEAMQGDAGGSRSSWIRWATMWPLNYIDGKMKEWDEYRTRVSSTGSGRSIIINY